jgi:PEP-CTERM motif
MRRFTKIGFAALLLAGVSTPAHAVTVVDATGDFLSGFIGPNDADLDVTSFSVTYDNVAATFTLGATFAGVIDPTKVGRYVIGVNTGTGVNAPFAGIGQGNVRFNQTVTVQKNGTGSVGATALAAGAVTISGNSFTAVVPISLLPTTGWTAVQYGWNLWPRNGGTGVTAISDFAPENSLLAISPIPEPATWLSMLIGFGLAGFALRQRTGKGLRQSER